LRAEREWLEALRREVVATAASEGGGEGGGDAGLQKLLALVAADKAGRLASLDDARPASGRRRWERPLLALAASVVLVQAAVIGRLLWPVEPTDGLRPLGATAPAVAVQASFRAGATEAAIRAALREVDGEIVAGPGALGIYTIQIRRGTAREAAAMLMRHNEIVENAHAVSP
jgi:hypothetical protein